MNLDPPQIEEVKKKFAGMQTRQDFIDLLNFVKLLIYGEKAHPFTLRQITYYATKTQHTAKGDRIWIPISKLYPEGSALNPFELNEAQIQSKMEKYLSNTDLRYKNFTIKKKSGGVRTIHAPVAGLKAIQKTIAVILSSIFEIHPAAFGFAPKKSIADNAQLHVGARYVYNIDLKDFFPSVDQARIWKCLQLQPFNLVDQNEDVELRFKKTTSSIMSFQTEHNETIFYRTTMGQINLIHDKSGFYENFKNRVIQSHEASLSIKHPPKNIEHLLQSEAKKYILTESNLKKLEKQLPSRLNLASLIAGLCCASMEVERTKDGTLVKEYRFVLPQGSPTSPIFTNIVCRRLDIRLAGVAKRFGLRYSRYADDITFSSMHNVYQTDSPFINELWRIIEQQNFRINTKKVRLQKRGYRQEVTGLLVNDKVNVQKRYLKELRSWIYLWERYGYEKATILIEKRYVNNKTELKNKSTFNLLNVVRGKINYLSMVKGKDSTVVLSLQNRFKKLNHNLSPSVKKSEHLYKILEIMVKNGIDSGMKIYNTPAL